MFLVRNERSNRTGPNHGSSNLSNPFCNHVLSYRIVLTGRSQDVGRSHTKPAPKIFYPEHCIQHFLMIKT